MLKMIKALEAAIDSCFLNISKLEDERDGCELSACAYANKTGKIEAIREFALQTFQLLTDLAYNEHEKYLSRCKELNIEPILDAEVNMNDFKMRPLDITDIDNKELEDEINMKDEGNND